MKKLHCILLFAFLLTACKGEAITPVSPTTASGSSGAMVQAVPLTATSAPTVSPTAVAEVTATNSIPPTNTPAPVIPTNPPDCTNRAAFVADVTVPDYTVFESGASIHKVWRVRNTGTCTWTSEYFLVFNSGDQMNAPNSMPLDTTESGQTLDLAVDMTAPSANATYRIYFEIHAPNGTAIPIEQGTLLWSIINVNLTTADSGGGNPISSPTAPAPIDTACAYTTNQANVDEVIAAINAYRAQNGLPPYSVNALLTSAAQSHSADMACNQLFYHNGSDGSTPTSRVAAAGYAASSVSENVYGSWPPLTGQGVVTWWATDQSDTRHNRNMLSTQYQEIGVAYAFYNNYGYYVVDFAAP
jgi:uncharacterized protein YkwD